VPGVALVGTGRHWVIRSGDAVTASIVTKGEAKIVKAPPAGGRARLGSGRLLAAVLMPASSTGMWLGRLS
jgi:hypothetical protein